MSLDKNNKQRDTNIDIMKALGIILVILGHIYHHSNFIYLFHMPLFFILSGATLIYSKNIYNIKKRFHSLLIPYFIFSFLSFLYWFLIESKFRPIHNDSLFLGKLGNLPINVQQFINIFIAENATNSFAYNVVLWFLPCLFVTDFIYSKIKNKNIEWALDIILIILYYSWIKDLPCLPWCLNLAIATIPFFSIGYHLYKPVESYLSQDRRIKKSVIILFITMFSIGAIIHFLDPQVDIKNNRIPIIFYVTACIGSLMIFCCSQIIIRLIHNKTYICNQFLYIGQNSLIIMCIHEPLKRIILAIASKLCNIPIDILRENLIYSIGITLIVLIACIPFIYLIQNFFPWILGKEPSINKRNSK